jgi:hypothetical protein
VHTDAEIELLRLKVMEDVASKFDALIKVFNENGSEFSRALKNEMIILKRETEKQVDEIYSYIASQLVSIQAGQKMLYDPRDGLLTKALNKVEMAVKMSTDAAACTVEARKAANDAALYIRANIFVTAITFLGILVTVVGGYFVFLEKNSEDDKNQNTMIIALQEKIKQDANNQRETITMMQKLYKKLGG